MTWFQRFTKAVTDHYIIALIIGALLIIAVIWGIGTYKDSQNIKIQANIDQDSGKANVISNLIVNQGNVVNEQANISNQAFNDFHNSVNTDSSNFTGNAENKFCTRFPCDSTCVEWRKRNNVADCR